MTIDEFVRAVAPYIGLLGVIGVGLAIFRFKYDVKYNAWRARTSVNSYKKQLDKIEKEMAIVKDFNDSTSKFLRHLLDKIMFPVLMMCTSALSFVLGLIRYIDSVTNPNPNEVGIAFTFFTIFFMMAGTVFLFAMLKLLQIWILIKNVNYPDRLAIYGGKLLNAAFEYKYIDKKQRDDRFDLLIDKELYQDNKQAIKEAMDKKLTNL